MNFKAYVFWLAATCLLLYIGSTPKAQAGPPGKSFRVVLDAGHGGHDPGCLGKFSMEKDLTFELSQMVGALINRFHPDVEVLYTRKRSTQFVKLDERAHVANKSKADLFISIHCNAHTKKDVYGTETFVMGLSSSDDNLAVAMRENAVILKEEGYEERYEGFDPRSPVSMILLSNLQHAYQERSLSLAAKVEQQFSQKCSRTSRGVKQAGFLVLAKTTMPSVLIEVGFLSNPEEEIYLNSDLGKANIAASIYRAFRDYKKEVEKQYAP